MPLIRKKLVSSEVYPDDIRYNPDTDTVQSLINGEWVDNPSADPRRQTTLPPRITADSPCDGAQSVTDAIANQIAATITAVGNASTAAQIAGLILGLFSFGVFAIFINIALTIAGAMIDAGEAALSDALTPTAFETLKCILSCHMDEQGRLNPGELGLVQSEVNDQIGGLAATILNSMLSLAGEGGINNLSALGQSEGNCSECGCVEYWCYEFDFTLTDGGWGVAYGTWTAGVGWVGTPAGTGVSIVISKELDPFTLTHCEIDIDADPLCNVAVIIDSTTAIIGALGVGDGTYFWDGTISGHNIILNPSAGGDQGGYVAMPRILFRGTGTNPFGTDNCE